MTTQQVARKLHMPVARLHRKDWRDAPRRLKILADKLRAAYGAGQPVDMMDKARTLPTSPQAQQQQQDVLNRILAA